MIEYRTDALVGFASLDFANRTEGRAKQFLLRARKLKPARLITIRVLFNLEYRSAQDMHFCLAALSFTTFSISFTPSGLCISEKIGTSTCLLFY